MLHKDWYKDTITLRGEEIELKVGFLNQAELQFFPENPRIYSIISAGDKTPSQEEILEALTKREHVRQLTQSIKANGGLTDPIFVREDNFIVLEGNSRLASYRLLANQDPIKWGKIKCKLLPPDIDEDKIFALLGEYHIIGKQDWVPFEQAGYLYRRHIKYNVSANDMASYLGLTTREVNRLIDVYSFMIKHNDKDPSKWSYYYEYLKSKMIKKCRKEYSNFDETIIPKIKSGEIQRATEIRDELPKIIKSGKKVINKLINGAKDFSECLDIAKAKGSDDKSYQHLKRFRSWLNSNEVTEGMNILSAPIKKKMFYELKKIRESIQLLEKNNKEQTTKNI